MVLIDVPFAVLSTLVVALVSLIGVLYIGYKLLKMRRYLETLVDALQKYAMDRAELKEYVQRQFVLLLKDDELFKKHIEERMMK